MTNRMWIHAAWIAPFIGALWIAGTLLADPPKPADKGGAAAGNGAPKDPRDAGKDAARDGRDAGADAARDGRDNGKDAGRVPSGPAKDSDRDYQGTAKDGRTPPRDGTADAPRPGTTSSDRRGTAEGRAPVRRTVRDLGLSFGRATDRGLAIARLAVDSALGRAGLREGDYLISVNGHRIEGPDDFDHWVETADPNARVTIIVWRDGREREIVVEPTVFYGNANTYDDDFTYFGVTLDDRYPDRIVVLRVEEDSPAYRAGLRPADVITTWHGQRIASSRDFGRVLHDAAPGAVDFEYERDSKAVRGEANFKAREEGKGKSEERREEPRSSEQPAPKAGETAPVNPPATDSSPRRGGLLPRNR